MTKAAFLASDGYGIISEWMARTSMTPFSFQQQTWQKYAENYSGVVVAPTGFGKTFSVFLAVLIDEMNHPGKYKSGLQLLWVTPLRSLAKDLARAMQQAIDEIGLDWSVEVRNGDTDPKIKQRQSRKMPEVLLVTPESLHLLLAQKGRAQFFNSLRCIAVDEWHELMGSKRGVMVELAVSYLKTKHASVRIWGITATIGNLDQAIDVLLYGISKRAKVVAREKKQIDIIPVYPDEVQALPWAGHLGASLADKVVPIVAQSRSTIVFTNTRSQAEQWYQLLLNANPDLAGLIALHHSSIDAPIRQWIEEALAEGRLKAVIATSSLDLGVDFKPVDTVVQVGSSKGVARFVQRAGRSGHSPFEVSKIYFVPTHSLELVEVAALKEAVAAHKVEERVPLVQCFDVLIQFMVTVALGGGFRADELYGVVSRCHAFAPMTPQEWQWCLVFITKGGTIGRYYEEFHKVEVEHGNYIVTNRRIGMLHRMNIGVIVSDAMLRVRFQSGGYIGMIEEYFVSKLKPGDKFVLAGRVLELKRFKDMIVQVVNSSGRAATPSWLGGRLPLSSNLSHFLRANLAESAHPPAHKRELRFLQPLIDRQKEYSHVPAQGEFLVEAIHTREGYHLFMYPLEGRLIHEVMSALVAYRLSLRSPISFSMAMNDYGFELFSDTEIELNDDILAQVLSKEHLMRDVVASINAAEMARRKFRDIAVISGLVQQNVYGKQRNNKSLQASAGLLFNVLEEHEPGHLLLRQAYDEVFFQQLEESRLHAAFERIHNGRIVFVRTDRFTPLSFPIKVDSLRQSLSSEDLGKRIARLQAQKPSNSRRR